MTNTVIAGITDLHVGSTTSISPPKFTIHTGRKDETQVVEANKAQTWLHSCFVDYTDYVKSLVGIRGKTRKSRLVIFILGDCVDGIHHNSVQVANEVEDQIEMCCNLLRPFTALADAVYLTYGTGSHNGGAAQHEVTIGRELGINHDWEYALDVDAVTFDLAHQGRAGRRDWTSSAAALAVEVATDYISDGKKPPRYVLRGHTHCIDDSAAKLSYTRAIVLPSWQLRTAYGHQIATNRKRSDIGGFILNSNDPDNPILSKMRYTAPGGWIRVEKV